MFYSDTNNTGNKKIETATVSKIEASKIEALPVQDPVKEYLEYNRKWFNDIKLQTDKIGETIDKMIEYRDYEIDDLIGQKQNLLVEIQEQASIMNSTAMKLKYATEELKEVVCARKREAADKYNAEEHAKWIKYAPLIIYASMFVLGIALSIANEWGKLDQLMYFAVIGVCVVFASVVLYAVNLNKITKSQKNLDELKKTEEFRYEKKDNLEKDVHHAKETIESLCNEIQIIDRKIFELWTEFAGHKEEDDENV